LVFLIHTNKRESNGAVRQISEDHTMDSTFLS